MMIRTIDEIKALPKDSVVAAIDSNNQLVSIAMRHGRYWHLPALMEPKTAEELFTATENGMTLQLLYPRRYGAGEVEWVARVLYQEQRADIGCPIAWDETNEALRRRFRKRARAALNALEGK